MSYFEECLEFFSKVPEILRPISLPSTLRNKDPLVFGQKENSHQLTIVEKAWLLRETDGENASCPPCLQKYRKTKKNILFFQKNSNAKSIVFGSGRREKIDKIGLIAIAATISELLLLAEKLALCK